MMHMSSLVHVDSTKHPHAVSVEVSWPVSEQEKAAGIEEEHITMEMRANPELALPSKPSDNTKPLQWSPQRCADYFWLIRRQGTVDDEWNCEIRMRAMTQVFCVQPVTDSDWKAEAITDSFTIKIPHIVNTKHIPADKEVVLRWQALAVVVQRPKRQPSGSSNGSNGGNRSALAALAKQAKRPKTTK